MDKGGQRSAVGGGATQSATNEFGKTNFGYRGMDIHSNNSVQQATDVLTIIRGEDGKPQIWSTGDPTKAEQLFRDAGPVLGIKDLQRA